MKIGIVCYPTYGGSGVVATELGKALAKNGHEVHFIAYNQPARLNHFLTMCITMRLVYLITRCLNTRPTKRRLPASWLM